MNRRQSTPGGHPPELLGWVDLEAIKPLPAALCGSHMLQWAALDVVERMKGKKLVAALKQRSALKLMEDAIEKVCKGKTREQLHRSA